MGEATARIPDLPTVRRYEAGGFRAWPATRVVYDGTWVIRLTPGHPAKRLNSVNPLDPRDTGRLTERIAAAGRLFADTGKPLTFRLSPLSGDDLDRHLDREGWSSFSESLVMETAITDAQVERATHRQPVRDIRQFMRAAAQVHGLDEESTQGMAGVIGSVKVNAGLFVLERRGAPVTTLVCVQDGGIAGLFEVATSETERGKGHGHDLMLSAIRWGGLAGARTAWLQVEADNRAAIELYRKMGFREAYRYHYRRPPEER
ncbi:MAG: GNAT family N-acetyltransferase [Rhizobiaceae bacterium]